MTLYADTILTSEEIISLVRKGGLDSKDLEELARRDDLPFEAQDLLSRSESTYVRVALAANETISTAVLSKLLGDMDAYVRSQAVAHPKVTGKRLCSFVDSDSLSAKMGAARNPNLTVEQVRQLAGDPVDHVVKLIAERSDLPADVVTNLTWHSSERVRTALGLNWTIPTKAWDLTTSAGFLVDYRPNVLQALAPECSREDLLALGATWHGDVDTLKEAILLTLRTTS